MHVCCARRALVHSLVLLWCRGNRSTGGKCALRGHAVFTLFFCAVCQILCRWVPRRPWRQSEPTCRSSTRTGSQEWVRAHTCTRTHVYTHTHTHTHTHAYTCTQTHAKTHTRAKTSTHMHTTTHTCKDTHTRAHTHAKTHTHVHTHVQRQAHFHTCAKTQARTHTCKDEHTCAHNHINTHVLTHAHTHTCANTRTRAKTRLAVKIFFRHTPTTQEVFWFVGPWVPSLWRSSAYCILRSTFTSSSVCGYESRRDVEWRRWNLNLS